MYSRPAQESESITLLEVYKTDEENWEQYIPNMGMEEEEEKEPTDEEEETEEEETEETDTQGFSLHQGEIIEIYYYGDFKELNFESDYTDINLNGSLKFGEIKDLTRFYKGVRLLLCKKMAAPNEEVTADDLSNVLLGFITEQSFNESGMDLTISGITKLLEQNYQFDFTQMKRSKILEEMIKTAGLKPAVDPTGLQDDVIDYSNISKSEDGDDSASGDASGAPNISAMVKQAIKGKKGARAKAEAIYSAMVNHLTYAYYACSTVPHTNEGADQAWKKAAVNCADSAIIGRVAYTAGGLKARCVHGPNHFWVEVNIDGNWVASDVTGAEGNHCVRSLGQVWDGLSKDSDNGDWPSC